MALITTNLKLYIPEVDDPNDVYVKGFTDNFNKLDELLKNLLTTAIATVTSTNNTDKRAVTDFMVHKYEGHILSKTDDASSVSNESTYGAYYGVNPHNISPAQLYIPTAERTGTTGRVTAADGIVHQINRPVGEGGLTMEGTGFARHRINWKIVNTQSGKLADIGSSINDRPHSALLFNVLDPSSTDTTKDKHLSNAQAKKYEDHVDTTNKATSNPHNVSAQKLTSSDDTAVGGAAIQRAINQQGVSSGIDWIKVNKTTSNLTDIVTRNHSDLQNIGTSSPISRDTTKDKHTSNLDTNELWGHLKSKANETGVKTIDGTGTGITNYPSAQINPHKIRAEDLWSSNTTLHKHGADTIINEINTNASSGGITTANTVDKIYWNLIDKNNADGAGGKANINSIPNRSHQELQNILPSVVTSTDTTANKHVSNSQVKKYEDHVNTVNKATDNPHNTSAQNLKSSTSTNTGGVAISEAINSQASANAISWSKVNKATSNLTEIVTRNHDDLQNIKVLDPASTDTTKNKHLSNAQAKQYQDHIQTTAKATSNPHNVSAQNLKSSDSTATGGVAIQRAINNQGLDGGINWIKITKANSNLTDIVTRNHNDLQNIGEVNILDSDGTKNKHVSNSLARKWDVHSDYISGGNIHRTTAYNLYTGGGDKNGGKAISEAINNQADSNAITWSKVNKATSNLTDIVTRNHNDLQNIGVAVSSTDGTQNKHISNANFKNWEDHRNNIVNPHGVTAVQLGGNAITNVINSATTTVLINRNRLNFSGFNITEITNRNHDDLNSIGIADVASTDTAKNKHVSNAQTKKWEDHANTTSGTNVHNVQASNIPITSINGVTATNIQAALEDITLKTTYDSAGLLTHTGNLTINATGVLAQANDWAMYHTVDYTGKLFKHTVPQKQFLVSNFTNNTVNYIYANYNISTGAVTYETTDNYKTLNWGNQLQFGEVHVENGVVTNVKRYSMVGNGATEKILLKDRDVNPFEIGEGLLLEDDSDKQGDGVTPINHHFKLSSGTVWGALEKFSCVNKTTKTGNIRWYKTKSDSSWEYEDVTAPIVWKKDTGSGITDGDDGGRDYAINWIYKDIITDHWYIVLGGITYKEENTAGLVLGYADAQPPLSLPSVIKERSVLVGKVVTEKGKSVNAGIYRTQGIIFTNTSTGYAPITAHNALQGIQGGTTGQRNHVTNVQISKIDSVEQNADVTDIQNVGTAITDIINNSTSEANITVDQVYTLAKKGANDMVKKAGDRMTGTLEIVKTGLAFDIGGNDTTFNTRDAWFRMGNNTVAFNHVYKGSEAGNNNAYELWTTNGHTGTNYNVNSVGRVWRITQDGVFNIYKNIVSSADIKSSTLNVTSTADITGQTKIKKGSTDWKDTVIKTQASIELGQDGGGYAGSIKLYGSDATRYGLIRMHKTNMFFDTAGKYYMNWDKTDTAGEFYLGDGVAHNTVEETRANYLVLRSNDKSYFKNGLQIKTTSNSAGYAADFGGTIHMHNNDINYVNQLHFEGGVRLMNESSSVIKYNSLHPTMVKFDFYSKDVFKGRIIGDGNNFGLQNKDNQWIIANGGADTVLYNAGNAKIRATSTGATINGILAVDTSISENGTSLASKYLGLTAKAADSELIDGIDSTRIIYGQNGYGSTRWNGDMNLIYKSGFFFGNPSSNQPSGSTYGHTIHCQYTENEKGGFQIYSNDNSSMFYMRSKSANSTSAWRSWATLYTTAHKPTKTDVGLGNLPNAKSDAINLDDTNVLATAKAVKKAYDLASAASDSATNADNAQKLDNLDSTQFLRSDADDTMNNILTMANGKPIYFNNSGRFIKNEGNNIRIQTTASLILNTDSNSDSSTEALHLQNRSSNIAIAYQDRFTVEKPIELTTGGAKIQYNSTTKSIDFVF